MSELQKLKGLLLPPANWPGSKAPPLVGAGSPVKVLSWDEIRRVALSGKMDGRKRYGLKFHTVQRHNNCAGAAASKVVAKSIYDARGDVLQLSDSFVYSLVNGGRDQGSMLSDAMEAIETVGNCLMSTCGPDAIFPHQYDKLKANAEAERFRVTECYAIRPRDFGSKDELQRAFWSALCYGYKCEVAIQAGSRFDSVNSWGVPGIDNGAGNHAIHCCGIAIVGSEIVATAENTWPLSLANGGRIQLRWSHFEQTIGVHEFFAARGVRGDTKDDRPKVK